MTTLPDNWLEQVKAAALEALETAAQPATQPDPTKAPPVLASEIHLAQSALRRRGYSEGDAAIAVLGSPLSSFAQDIEAERAILQMQADRAAADAYAASPEGRAAEAARIREESARLETLDNDARTLLTEQGWSEDDMQAVGQQARLRAAGLIEDPNEFEWVPGQSDDEAAERAYLNEQFAKQEESKP